MATHTNHSKDKIVRELPVLDSSGKKVDTVTLDEKLFTGRPNRALLAQLIIMYQANKRQGTVNTKTHKDVRGGGKKPWKQKGTGRARAGSIRSPLWRGGGVVFGPHPRDYSYNVPKQMRRLGLIEAVNAKLAGHDIFVLDSVAVDAPKTKKLAALLTKTKAGLNALILMDEALNKNLMLSARNIPRAEVRDFRASNALEILLHRRLVFSRDSLAKFTKWLHKS